MPGHSLDGDGVSSLFLNLGQERAGGRRRMWCGESVLFSGKLEGREPGESPQAVAVGTFGSAGPGKEADRQTEVEMEARARQHSCPWPGHPAGSGVFVLPGPLSASFSSACAHPDWVSAPSTKSPAQHHGEEAELAFPRTACLQLLCCFRQTTVTATPTPGSSGLLESTCHLYG